MRRSARTDSDPTILRSTTLREFLRWRACEHASAPPTIAFLLGLLCLASGVGADTAPASGRREIPERSLLAPWKGPVAGREAPRPNLEAFSKRIGTWLTDEWQDGDSGRHRYKIVYTRDLGERLLTEQSSTVFEDGTEERYLVAILYENPTSRATAAAHLYFKDGLYADATWIDDGDGVHRLDCDLVFPNGSLGRVRDFFLERGEDTIEWTTYFFRGETMDSQPAATFTLRRQAGPDVAATGASLPIISMAD